MVQYRAPEAVCLFVEPALGEAEEEEREEGGVGEGLGDVVRGGEENGGTDCQRDGGVSPPRWTGSYICSEHCFGGVLIRRFGVLKTLK